jgi:glycerophosphoryl diester phosphodiesterase
MVTIVAHRGWAGAAPENTLAAFELALSESDIPMIELDVHLSRDGVPVVIHDHSLERTTNGQGLVKMYRHDELRELDAGSWFGPEYAGERIPTLDEVLRLTKGRCRLQVELKVMGKEYEGIEAAVIGSLRKHDMLDQASLISFDHDAVKRAKSIDPAVQTGLIFFGKPTMIPEQLQYTGATSLSMHYGYVTRVFVDEMRAYGIDTGVWTVNDPELLARIVSDYPGIRITTDYPDRLLAIIRSKATA